MSAAANDALIDAVPTVAAATSAAVSPTVPKLAVVPRQRTTMRRNVMRIVEIFLPPLLGMLLVFLGLSVILRDQNRNVILSAGSCLMLCGVFFLCSYGCKMLGENDYLAPALAAWLPLLIFGPLALVFFDAVHT